MKMGRKYQRINVKSFHVVWPLLGVKFQHEMYKCLTKLRMTARASPDMQRCYSCVNVLTHGANTEPLKCKLTVMNAERL